MPKGKTVRIRNRPLTTEEVSRSVAADERHNAETVAQDALKKWYRIGYQRAEESIPKMQRLSNLGIVASIPGWCKQKGTRNGYVMLTSLLSGELRPVILALDYEIHPSGGLTRRQLHQQVRVALELEPKVSLRMRPSRPWYQHMQGRFPIPEHLAINALDHLCTHLLGTTLLYYTYVHLTD